MHIQKSFYLVGLMVLVCYTQQTFGMFSRLMSRIARPGLRSLTVNSPLRNQALIRTALRTSTQQTPLSCESCDRNAEHVSRKLQCGKYEMTSESESHEAGNVQKVLVKTKDPKKVTVLGTWHTGLVSGLELADIGHQVIGADTDVSKIEALRKGIVSTVYEPGLKELINRNVQEGRLSFTNDIPAAIRGSDIIFITIDMIFNTAPNWIRTLDAAITIGENLNEFKVIVIKSILPIKVALLIKDFIEKNPKNIGKFAIVSNPEFLRKGLAVKDFMRQDRIYVASTSERAARMMRELYCPLTDAGADLFEAHPL